MENDLNKKIKLGFFISLGVIFFMLGVYYISKKNIFTRMVNISGIFKDAIGLQSGNNVRLLGINIGVVRDIKIQNDSSITVILAIQKDAIKYLKLDAVATIGTEGLMGNKVVDISPGSSFGSSLKENDFIRTKKTVQATDLFKSLGNTGKNAEVITDNLGEILIKINEGRGPLGTLIKDSVFAQDIYQTLLNIKYSSIRLNQIMQTVNEGIINNLSKTSSNSEKLTTDLAGIMEITRDSILGDLKVSSANANRVTTDLSEIIGRANKGNGAFGKLFKDSAFAENLNQTMINLKTGSEKFSDNMEALKSNYFFKGYFRKLQKEQEIENLNNKNKLSKAPK